VVEVLDRAILFECEIKGPLPGGANVTTRCSSGPFSALQSPERCSPTSSSCLPLGLSELLLGPESRVQMMSSASQGVKNREAIKWF
jgi:hypothetical protein